MQQQILPSTVLHYLLNNYLHSHDQLIFAKIFHTNLVINDQSLATILRHARSTNLHHLSHPILIDNNRYIYDGDRVSLPNSAVNWSMTLAHVFNIDTFNRVWGYFSTDLFRLYSRLFSFCPFFYRPQYPLIDVFKIPCEFITTKLNKKCIFFRYTFNKKFIQFCDA